MSNFMIFGSAVLLSLCLGAPAVWHFLRQGGGIHVRRVPWRRRSLEQISGYRGPEAERQPDESWWY